MRPWFSAWWTMFRFRHALLEMLVCLSLAFLVWLYTQSRAQTTIDHVPIPVKVQLSPAQRDLYGIEVNGDAKILASFSGPASRIRELRRNILLNRVQVIVTMSIGDNRAKDAVFYEAVQVDPHQIPVPSGVMIEMEEGSNTVPVTVNRLVERMLPVKFDYSGDVRVTQVKLEPSTVLVRGPKQVLDNARALATQAYALTVPPDDATEPIMRGQVPLLAELEGRAIVTNPQTITFHCKVQPKQRIYNLRDIAVHFLVPTNFPWRPGFVNETASHVNLRILGPASEEPPPVQAFVDLTDAPYQRGRNIEPLRLQLPKDFTLISGPSVIPFVLEEANSPVSTETPGN